MTNPLLADPHRRDVIIGDGPGDYLIRLFAMTQMDGGVKLVKFRVARIFGADAGQRIYQRDDREQTFSPDEAAILASGSVRWDGVTALSVETIVDSKEAMWQLLAAVEQARRECAEQMGGAYMDRFEYGREKKR